MGFFDDTARKLDVPEGGGGLIKDDDAGANFEKEIEQTIAQIEALDQQASAPPQPTTPPVQAEPSAPPPPAPPDPPQPTTDPKLLELIERQGQVLEQFAQSQGVVKEQLTERQQEQQRISEMQAWGMDPADAKDVRQYFLYKEQQSLKEQLENASRFQTELQQRAQAFTAQQQVQAGLKASAPHLTEAQVAFYAQRAAQEAIQTGQPVETVVAEYARHLAPAAPAQPKTAPAAPQPAALPMTDPVAMMQLLAQMNGSSAQGPQGSGTQSPLKLAEKLFFGGR